MYCPLDGLNDWRILIRLLTKRSNTMKAKLKNRNGHAFHPIMTKGGVHEKSTGAKRLASKRKWQKEQGERATCSPHFFFFNLCQVA